MDNWQRHGALPTGATLVRAELSATAWSQRKHSRTQTKVQEAEVHLDYKTLDGTVHTVVDKAQRIGDGQIKVVYGLTSRTLALKMASELPLGFGEDEVWRNNVELRQYLPTYYGRVMVATFDHDSTWTSDIGLNRGNYLYLCDKVLETVEHKWKLEMLQPCSEENWKSHVTTWAAVVEMLLTALKRHDALFWDYKGDNIGWLADGRMVLLDVDVIQFKQKESKYKDSPSGTVFHKLLVPLMNDYDAVFADISTHDSWKARCREIKTKVVHAMFLPNQSASYHQQECPGTKLFACVPSTALRQRACVHVLMLFERMTVRNQFLFCVDPKHESYCISFVFFDTEVARGGLHHESIWKVDRCDSTARTFFVARATGA